MVVPFVLTPHRPVSRLPKKATPNPGTVGTTTCENSPTIIGDPTLQQPLAIPLRNSQQMATSPLQNMIIGEATTSASTVESLDMSTVTALAMHVQPSTTPVVPERDQVMLPQHRPNQPTNATTTNVAMVATAMDSLVKGTLGAPPLLSRLPTHQQNPQLLHPPRLARETCRRPSRSAERGLPFPSCCT